MPGAVLRAGATERVGALLSWEFSGCARYSGTSAASQTDILLWSPFSRGREEAEHRGDSSQGPRWHRQSGTRLSIFPRPPGFTPPCHRHSRAGMGPFVRRRCPCHWLWLASLSSWTQMPPPPPRSSLNLPLLAWGPFALTVSLACRPVASSSLLLLLTWCRCFWEALPDHPRSGRAWPSDVHSTPEFLSDRHNPCLRSVCLPSSLTRCILTL